MYLPIAFFHELKELDNNLLDNNFLLFHLICLVPGSTLIFTSIAWIMSDFNINLVIGVALTFSIPSIIMLFRWDTFNDGFIIIEFDNHKEAVVGYNVIYYNFIIFFIGLYGYYFGFSNLSFGNTLSIIWIFVVFLFQLGLVFPDRINNVLPFELRKAKYCAMFLVLWLVLFALFVLFFQPLLLGSGFSLFNTLTLEGFFKSGIYYIIVIILAFLIYRMFRKK